MYLDITGEDIMSLSRPAGGGNLTQLNTKMPRYYCQPQPQGLDLSLCAFLVTQIPIPLIDFPDSLHAEPETMCRTKADDGVN